MSLIPKKPFVWIMIAVVAYGYLSYYQSLPKPEEPENENKKPFWQFNLGDGLKKIEDKFKDSQAGNAIVAGMAAKALQQEYGKNDITAIAAIESGLISSIDRIKGFGNIAVCGSKITMHYDSQTSKGVGIDDTRDSKPVTFVLGEKQMIDAFEIGLWGAKRGMSRKIASPRIASYENAAGSNIDLSKEALLINVEVIKIEDGKALPDNLIVTNKYITKPKDVKQAKCGDVLKIAYKTKEQSGEIELGLEKDKLPLGMEMALIGMRIGEEKEVQIPAGLMTQISDEQVAKIFSGKLESGYNLNLKLLEIVDK